jgi:hypothetical protein
MPETVTSERRKRSRQRPPSLVYVELATQNGGMMRDLGEEGFAVRAMMPLRLGEKTPFSFSLNEFIRIDGEGSILWVEEKGRVAGVKFTQVSSTARAQIHGWLNGAAERVQQQRMAAPEAPTLEQLREELRASPPRPLAPKPTETPVSPAASLTVSETREEAKNASVAAELPWQSQPQEEAAAPLGRESEIEAVAQVEISAIPDSEAILVESPQDKVDSAAPDVMEEQPAEEMESAGEVTEPKTEHESVATPVPEAGPVAPEESADEPTVEEETKVSAEQLPSTESTLAQTEESRPPLATALSQAAGDVIQNVADVAKREAAKEESETRSNKHEPETASVSSLFTPAPELLHQRQQAEPPIHMWRADGQIPPVHSVNAASAAAELHANSGGGPESEQQIGGGDKSDTSARPKGESNTPTKPGSNLPRLALRLNAEDYVKQRFPFAVGPLPPAREPAPEERPKRFWANTTPKPAEERPVPTFQEIRPAAGPVNSVVAPEPAVHTAGERYENAPILPDISAVLIHPASTTRSEHGEDSAVLEKLRPWPEEPRKRKESWAEWFTLPRAVGIMLLLAILLGLYLYRQEAGQGLIWLGEQIGGQGAQNERPAPVQATQDNQMAETSSSSSMAGVGSAAQQSGESARPEESQTNDSGDSQNQKSPPSAGVPSSRAQTPASSKPKSVTQGISDFSSAPVPESGSEQGQAEYQQAVHILQGKYPSYSQAEAVRLLWAAVEKRNPNAELMLADMYWHGKGLPRNCDQTRILLTAASRKGSAEAQRKLQEFQQQGCE